MRPYALIDRVLAAMDVDVHDLALSEIGPAATLEHPPAAAAEILHVLSGTLWLELDGGVRLTLPAGAIVLTPPRSRKRFASALRPVRSCHAVEVCVAGPCDLTLYDAAGGSGGDLRVFSGRIRANLCGCYDPFAALASPLSANLNGSSFGRAAVEAMLSEARAPVPGSYALTRTLMKACFVELLRNVLEPGGDGVYRPDILTKPWLSRAITTIAANPRHPHTVASLAKCSGMSRSRFAKAFGDTTGTTPMEFVMRARLVQARDMLTLTEMPIGAIATDIGFASRSHFSRLFRNAFGLDPSSYRRTNGLHFGVDRVDG